MQVLRLHSQHVLEGAAYTICHCVPAQVLEVGGGVAKLKFGGPAPIGMGVQAAIKDRFPDIRTVELCA